MPSRQTLADESPHRRPHPVHRPQAKCPDQRDDVIGKRVHVVAGRGHRRVPLAAPIDGNASVAVPQRLDLVAEQPAAEQQAVTEHDGLGVRAVGRGAGVGIGDASAVYVDRRHRKTPNCSGLAVIWLRRGRGVRCARMILRYPSHGATTAIPNPRCRCVVRKRPRDALGSSFPERVRTACGTAGRGIHRRPAPTTQWHCRFRAHCSLSTCGGDERATHRLRHGRVVDVAQTRTATGAVTFRVGAVVSNREEHVQQTLGLGPLAQLGEQRQRLPGSAPWATSWWSSCSTCVTCPSMKARTASVSSTVSADGGVSMNTNDTKPAWPAIIRLRHEL
jgi:hypothetical protein